MKANINRPASEVFTSSNKESAEEPDKSAHGFGKRKSSSSQSALIQSSSKINNRYSTQVPLMQPIIPTTQAPLAPSNNTTTAMRQSSSNFRASYTSNDLPQQPQIHKQIPRGGNKSSSVN